MKNAPNVYKILKGLSNFEATSGTTSETAPMTSTETTAGTTAPASATT